MPPAAGVLPRQFRWKRNWTQGAKRLRPKGEAREGPSQPHQGKSGTQALCDFPWIPQLDGIASKVICIWRCNPQNGVSKGGHPLWPPEAIYTLGQLQNKFFQPNSWRCSLALSRPGSRARAAFRKWRASLVLPMNLWQRPRFCKSTAEPLSRRARMSWKSRAASS